MSTFRRVRLLELERAKAIRDQYSLVASAMPPVGTGAAQVRLVINNPLFDWADIAFDLDGEFAGEAPFVWRGADQEEAGFIETEAGQHTLSLGATLTDSSADDCRCGDQWFTHVSSPVTIPSGESTVLVDFFDRFYPPAVFLNGTLVNCVPGLRYNRQESLPRLEGGVGVLDILDDVWTVPVAPLTELNQEETIGLLPDIWIDGERVESLNTSYSNFATLILHRVTLSTGLHHVRIGDARKGTILLDSDLVIDGVSQNSIAVTGRQFAELRSADEQLLYQDSAGGAFQQGFSPVNLEVNFGRSVDGVPLPYGIEGWIDEIEKERDFEKQMVSNYELFVALKKAAEEKKKSGQQLTPEEKEADELDTCAKLQDWIKKKKKKLEGVSTAAVAGTDYKGRITLTGPAATNPLDQLINGLALQIHEPSHSEDVRVMLVSFGIDRQTWIDFQDRQKKIIDDLEKAIKALKKGEKANVKFPMFSTDPLDDWYKDNKEKIKRYLKAFENPLASALSEIREYKAGVEFLDNVLKALERKGWLLTVPGMQIKLPVGTTKEFRVQQIPDSPPRLRVIEGENNADITGPDPERHMAGAGQFKVTVEGKAKGRMVLEFTCGRLKKRVVVLID